MIRRWLKLALKFDSQALTVSHPKVRAGHDFLERRKFEEAFKSFQEAFQENHSNTDASSGMGDSLVAVGGDEAEKRAIGCYRLYLKYKPFDFNYYKKISGLYNNLGRYKQANTEKRMMFVAKKLKKSPHDSNVNHSFAMLHLMQASYYEAIRYFKNAVTYNPEFDRAYYHMGITWYRIALKKKEPEKVRVLFQNAITSIEQSITLNKTVDALVVLGKIYLEQKKIYEAESALYQAKEMDNMKKNVIELEQSIQEFIRIQASSQLSEEDEKE